MEQSAREGTIPFTRDGETHHTWYKVYGDLSDRTRTPLVVVHGGPGLSHDYLIPLVDLCSQPNPIPIIFYDQIGNARSTHLDDKPESFWTVDFFIDELVNVLLFLGVQDSVDLLGHSWGGMLVAEYIIRRNPTGVRHLIIADSLASRSLAKASIARCMAGMPEDVKTAIQGQNGKIDMSDEKYVAAMQKFNECHGTRGCNPIPEPMVYSFKQRENPVVVNAMNKNEIGDSWDITEELHLIRIPTLVVHGKYDFLADASVPFIQNIPNSKHVLFEESSHVPHWEERGRYVEVVRSFLEL